ncbi:hypothetical protein GUJ93_ZPchr0006g40610 [Zizania palustris]|uniref:Uncharacterized protein n=1 Tax=Zizania palustris TaxID=103762 RepID=A0A8J5W327_ZIZPA|nr:hypothetical protein GUJ93_ZPchr0006g40610 [Zizania palustris]
MISDNTGDKALTPTRKLCCALPGRKERTDRVATVGETGRRETSPADAEHDGQAGPPPSSSWCSHRPLTAREPCAAGDIQEKIVTDSHGETVQLSGRLGA